MSMSALALPALVPQRETARREVIPVTLGELISVLSELTDDDREIVATAIHMVESGQVRLLDREVH